MAKGTTSEWAVKQAAKKRDSKKAARSADDRDIRKAAPSAPGSAERTKAASSVPGSVERTKKKDPLPGCCDCAKEIAEQTRALICERCDHVWKCADCIGLSDRVYEELTANSSLHWFCES